MKPTELRIGCLVESDGIFAVSSIIETDSGYDIEVRDSNQQCWIFTEKEIHPIILSEDWIVKLGWIWWQNTKSFEKVGFVQGSIRETPFGWEVFNYVLQSVTCRKINYVHQLQNLYFALTGEELTINTEQK